MNVVPFHDTPHSTLLRGGHVICPASGLDGVMDVAGQRRADRRSRARPRIRQGRAEVTDVRGKLVLPGMIDTHAHVYQYVTGRFGMAPDLVGVQSGVTTVVDQGGPSCMTLPGFRHFCAEPASTRVYAFISAYLVGGLEGHFYPELYSPSGVNVAATVAAARANPDLVRGIKAHAEIGGFARWGIRVIEMAAEIGEEADLPVYVHFGQLWGLPESGTNGEDVDTILERVIPLLREGDILAHPFTKHPGGFVDTDGRCPPGDPRGAGSRAEDRRRPRQPFLLPPRPHGAGGRHRPAHAGRRHARLQHPRARRRRAPPRNTPTRRTTRSRARRSFSLTQAMSSMMALGLSLQEVVPMVTTNPAAMLGRSGESARWRWAGSPTSRCWTTCAAVSRCATTTAAGGGRAAAAAGVLPAGRAAVRVRCQHPARGGGGLGAA